MSYNLFIAYDLMTPGQNYEAVRDAIKSLGQWHQFQLSLFYVHTQHNPSTAFSIVAAAADTNDRIAVINAHSGVISNWDNPPIDAINSIWAAGQIEPAF
ncbi:hypothetical protein [Microbulbifer celer]|uniref:Uncharacterized protein n=1 Tax=Microbulbifer celer TaxID=435905 RepID=A0ABW3U6B5_9GAMM|nr:hypothetical protein [Microbulbifer celer]UFN58559.1 hypothetical protein LPW13_05820 [Microbulbifer celer]